MNNTSLRTFVAANSPQGFYPLFSDLLKDKKTYIIKGGPGTGKSSLMKKIAANAYKSGYFTEYIYCSSDPDSLDAVYIPEINTVVCDGTAPHTVDPVYAGSEGGIINLGQCWDEKKLIEAKKEIRGFSANIKTTYDRAYRYLIAASSAYTDIKKIASGYINKEKLNKFIKNFISVIPEKNGKIMPNKRFLSSFSPFGYITFKDSIYSAEKVFVINDKYGLAYMITEKCEEAAQAYERYIFYNPLCPTEISHILIPELDTAIVTETLFTGFEPQNTNRINFSRFINDDISLKKNKLLFARKIVRMCSAEALNCIKYAKQLHDDLEDIYISSMNFDLVNKIAEEYVLKIFS